MYRRLISLVLLAILPTVVAAAKGPVSAVNTSSPRSTLESFLDATEAYAAGIEAGDPASSLKEDLEIAVACLNLEALPPMNRTQAGQDAAIYIKEIIDRIAAVDLESVPGSEEVKEEGISKWQLKDTEIVISRVEEGERAGEFLFSPRLVARAELLFERVKDLDFVEGAGKGGGYREPYLQRIAPEWAKEKVLEIAIWQWFGLLIALFLGITLRAVVRALLLVTQKLTRKTQSEWDDHLVEALTGPLGLILACGFWLLCLEVLRFSGVPLAVITTTVQVLFFGALIWLFYRLAGVLGDYLKELAEKTESTIDDQIVKMVSSTLKVFVVLIGVILAAQNLGFNVVSLLAGLGIGGLAIALAAQDTLSNFLGSLMIMLDRPFQVGHWIKVGGADGTVEDVGFRSTRIRTFYNSVISIPNSELMNTQIDNMGMREFRRVVTTLGITYDTPPEKMEAFLEGIKNIIKANPHTRKDYFHVVFTDFGASSLDIMVYFFLKVPDWSSELVEKQHIFLEIMRLAQAIGVDFAYPTQSLHIETFPEKTGVRKPHEFDVEELRSSARSFGVAGANAKPDGLGIFRPPHIDRDQDVQIGEEG